MATNAQRRPDRTLALAAPTHAIRTPVRSTALRVACWAGGIVLWLALAYVAGAEPVMGSAAAASAPRAPSALLRRLKPAAPSPSRARLPPIAATAVARPKALDVAKVHRLFNRWTGVHFYTADAAERATILATWPQFAAQDLGFLA
jgi:hypothetical protein